MRIEFKEEQRFNQWWLWLLLLPLALLPLAGLFKHLNSGRDFVEQPSSILLWIFMSLTIWSVLVLIYLIRLKTRIDRSGIEMHFFPFVSKKIPWEQINSARVVNYGFVGGWGIRLWTSYGTVYNIKGNKGLALSLKNGKKILIGTQKESELEHLFRQIELPLNKS
jgi:hypothetical protein